MSPRPWSVSPRNHPSLPSLRLSEPFYRSPRGRGSLQVSVRPQTANSLASGPPPSYLLFPLFLVLVIHIVLLLVWISCHLLKQKGRLRLPNTGDGLSSPLGQRTGRPPWTLHFQCIRGQEMMTNHSQHKAQDAHHPLSLRVGISHGDPLENPKRWTSCPWGYGYPFA